MPVCVGYRTTTYTLSLPLDLSRSVAVTRDRRESLRWTLGDFLIAPEEGARLRINPDYALAQKLHVLFATARLHDNRRGIARRIGARNRRFPDDRARLFVERHHRGLFTAGRY